MQQILKSDNTYIRFGGILSYVFLCDVHCAMQSQQHRGRFLQCRLLGWRTFLHWLLEEALWEEVKSIERLSQYCLHSVLHWFLKIHLDARSLVGPWGVVCLSFEQGRSNDVTCRVHQRGGLRRLPLCQGGHGGVERPTFVRWRAP